MHTLSLRDLEHHTAQMIGPMFETLVLGQMVRAGANQGLSTPIYFYRDHYGHEVDFVIAEGEKLPSIRVQVGGDDRARHAAPRVSHDCRLRRPVVEQASP